jgi:hypothetical protein
LLGRALGLLVFNDKCCPFEVIDHCEPVVLVFLIKLIGLLGRLSRHMCESFVIPILGKTTKGAVVTIGYVTRLCCVF